MEFLHILKLIAEILGEYWPLGLLIAASILAFIYGGHRLAIAVAAIGFALIAYIVGRKDARAQIEARTRRIEEERKKAYDQIDARRTARSDVAERLRKRDF